MKINEKWTLFLIATFVTFFGVVDTLIKGTKAIDDDNISNIQSNITEKDTNCDLIDIQLSDGAIEFDCSITEYNITVKNFNLLEVIPIPANDKASFIVDTNVSLDGKNSVVITVQAENGNTKIYTIYVDEYNNEIEKDNNKNYVPIFIAIIIVLMFINVFRIVRNIKNKG